MMRKMGPLSGLIGMLPGMGAMKQLKGAEVDFVDTVTGGGFTIKNPNATSTCGCSAPRASPRVPSPMNPCCR